MDEKIRRLAAYYIRHFQTNNPYQIAEQLNIRLFRYPLGPIAGQYQYLEHTRCIFLNSDIEDERFLRIVMAHELGHAILHMKENCCFMKNHTLLSTSRIERQANLLAAELLIPESILFEYAGYTITQIAQAEGWNKELLELKFH